MSQPAELPVTLGAPTTLDAGSHIGPYKLIQLIGEGGFGAVFEAEQERPVKRRVALKLIKLGMDTRDVIARFEAERLALARMEHPHIARVLDAGATENGRPYFVMELVYGEPISRYCERHKLTVTARLKLFEQICAAVQHAHTKGIIHRDLKPSNILVGTHDGAASAKVIDFGIAKATSGQLSEQSALTAQFQMMGTPLYMSPEQAQGSADIDTRTDIYSLGVVLYELLTGTTPFAYSLQTAAYGEVQRIICEVDPPLPSARVNASKDALKKIALFCQLNARALVHLLRGELDWIVMKAIEKDRARRYPTANALALDVQRYLDGQPVMAAPPSTVYWLRKFIRRHQLIVASGLLVTASLLAGVIGFASQARIARAQARIAVQRTAELEAVSNFQANMLSQVEANDAGMLLSNDVIAKLDAALLKSGMSTLERQKKNQQFAELWSQVNATDSARELIDQTILKPAVIAIDTQFKQQPIIDASLRQVLADRYVRMGLYDAALVQQSKALEIRRRVLGNSHPDTMMSVNNFGELYWYQDKLELAAPYLREALTQRRRILGETHPETLKSIVNVGSLLLGQGKLEEAEPYFREALEKTRQLLGEDNPATLEAVNNLGYLLRSQQKFDEAYIYLDQALAKSKRVLGEDHPDTLNSISNMALLLRSQGKLGEAESYLRDVLTKRRRVLGEEHPDTVGSTYALGAVLLAEGKHAKAEPYLLEALTKSQKVLGENNPNTLIVINDIGALFIAQGKNSEALDLMLPIEASTRANFKNENLFRVARLMMNLGLAHSRLNQFNLAEKNLLEAHIQFESSPGPDPNDIRKCRQDLIALYQAWELAQPGNGFSDKATIWQRKLAVVKQ